MESIAASWISTAIRRRPSEESFITDPDTIDSVIRFTDGGAIYGLVVVKPLSADTYLQNRLLDKIEAYIQDFYSEESLTAYGRPSIEKSQIHVRIHPDSDPIIFELLERCRQWVESNHIEFKVDTNIEGNSQASH